MEAAAKELATLAEQLNDGRTTREDFDPVLAEIEAIRRESFGPRPRRAAGRGAKARILSHFREHVGEEIYGEELAAVSCSTRASSSPPRASRTPRSARRSQRVARTPR